MTFLPKTVSRDVATLIGTGPILDKLRTRPPLLLKFFLQAMQSDNWCLKERALLSKIVSVVTEMTLSNILPFNDVVKAMDTMCKFHKTVNLPDFHNDLTLETPFSNHFYSRLFLMRSSPALRSFFYDFSTRVKFSHDEFTPFLKDAEFLALYRTLLSNSFSEFLNYPIERLCALILQCISWEYDKGVTEFQRILCLRIDSHLAALEVLMFAKEHNLAKIEAYATEFLDNLIYDTGVSNKKEICLSTYYVRLRLNGDDEILTADERRSVNHSFLAYKRQMVNVRNVPVESMHLMQLDKERYSVGFTTIASDEEVNKLKNCYGKSNYTFNRRIIRKLALEGEGNISHKIMLGAAAYFDNANHIEIFNYSLTFTFLMSLRVIKPNLKTLKFINCTGLTEELLCCIVTLFKDINDLYFSNIPISETALINIFGLNQLQTLVLDKCSLEFPQDLGSFSTLTDLGITDSDTSVESLQNIWKATNKLRSLGVVNLKNFNLNAYPFPERIEEFLMHSDQLVKYIEGTEIPALHRFKSLKSIGLYGEPTAKLKPILLNFMMLKTYKITFMGKIN